MRIWPAVTRAIKRTGGVSLGGAHVLPAARLGGPMPWIIAIMVALCVLTAGGALALANFASRAQAGLEDGLTVQIVEADPATRDAQARAATELLQRQPGVSAVRLVPQSELALLVEPWLGEAATSQAIVLPTLIEVQMAQTGDAALVDRLRRAVATVAPSARVDPQATWLDAVFNAIRALRWLSLVLIMLLTAASAAAVWLAARNAFDANRPTIEIVHHLGAEDEQIGRLFQRSVFADAALGGLLGLLFGSAMLMLLRGQFAALDSSVVAQGGLGPIDWLLIALIPALMTGVALFTARRTVLTRLERML